MRAVLYADSDMEPITVIDIPQWAAKMLQDHRVVRFVIPQYVPVVVSNGAPPSDCSIKDVAIWGERFVRHGIKSLMLFTRDDELAMLLRAEFLPGQRSEVAKEYRKGVCAGFYETLTAMRGLE